MRDPDRIDVVLAYISQVWHKHPDLRLCQLIVNAVGAGDPYHVEDDRLLEGLRELDANMKSYPPPEVKP